MRRPDPAKLRTIAAIRDMQAAAARAEAAKASAALDARKEVLADTETQRDVTVASWQAALAAPSLAIETLPLWAQEVMRQDVHVRSAERGVTVARADLDARAQDYQAATNRADLAHDIARKTAKEHAAERDEAALNAAADLYLQRRKTP
jgi:hypothetical protein